MVLALLTDGLERLCLNSLTWEPYSPFFNPIFKGLTRPLETEDSSHRLAEFLASPRVSKQTQDDKTLIVISRLQEPQEELPSADEAETTRSALTSG